MITSADLRGLPIFAALQEQQREHFATKAAEVRLNPEEWLVYEGEPSAFYVLLEGTILVWKELNGAQQLLHTRGPATFFGEVPILMGSAALSSIQAQSPCRVARFEGQQLQEMINQCSAFGETIYQTMTERISMIQNYARATPSARVSLRGQPQNFSGHAICYFLFAHRIQYEISTHAAYKGGSDRVELEVVIDGTSLPAPVSVGDVARALGFQTVPLKAHYDLVIIGGGPAGMAAAVYGASEGLATLLIERTAIGGQAGTSSRIENYLGFPSGVSGTELSGRALKQAQRFGAEIVVTRQVTGLEKRADRYLLSLDQEVSITGSAVLLATGVEWRRLHAPGIEALLGKGVFYGASRTDALSLAGRRVYLVGGGNSAGQAAMFFSAYAEEVYLLVRGSGLEASMSRYLIEQLHSKRNVHVHTHTTVVCVQGRQKLERLVTRVEHADSNYTEEHVADALSS